VQLPPNIRACGAAVLGNHHSGKAYSLTEAKQVMETASLLAATLMSVTKDLELLSPELIHKSFPMLVSLIHSKHRKEYQSIFKDLALPEARNDDQEILKTLVHKLRVMTKLLCLPKPFYDQMEKPRSAGLTKDECPSCAGSQAFAIICGIITLFLIIYVICLRRESKPRTGEEDDQSS
jgi:hypothetical protein